MPAAKESPIRHRKIGAYRVLGELGRGGMAQVYRGVHELLQREVAIKELLPGTTADKESVSRFRREALALANFRHQNIVTLYDLVEKNDSLFMVMEYVDGPTLASVLKDGPLPPEVAAIVAARIASALDHAHFARIIHRDIKPANVMLTKTGEVKLMDFGIAKDEGLEALTKEGIAVGTPSYMSPEQVSGTELGPGTDIFSLGVVLYECLTGDRPFLGATAGEVFARIRDGKYKPMNRIDPRIPRGLEYIVRQALRTDIKERYLGAAHIRRDLELYLANHTSVSHAALLVAFLKHRGQITETEALARLNNNELKLVETFERAYKKRKRKGGTLRWLTSATVLGGAGAGLYATQHLWLPLLQSAINGSR